MTIQTFPTLLGLAWPVKRTSRWSTIKQDSISGKKTRLQLWTAPLYKYELTITYMGAGNNNGLMNTDWQTMMGFWNLLGGAARPFHFHDTADDTATAQQIGLGDTVTTDFPFVRALGGFIDPIQDVNSAGLTVFVNGSPVSPTTYDLLTDPNFGFIYGVRFHAAPAAVPIAATFTYNWPCAFEDDTMDFEEFMFQFWRLQKVMFESWKL